LTRRLCDRHRGIGADGILFITQVNDTFRMIVSNADGSRPEMCGNGLRCVAAYLAQRSTEEHQTPVEHLGLRVAFGALRPKPLTIATDAGDKRCLIERSQDHFAVTVDMGTAKQTPPLDVTIAEKHHAFTSIDIGNPHAITFDPAYTQADIDIIGPLVATSIPGGTNVEFCQIQKEAQRPRIEVTVWERGVGRTLACGTGACAVAAAACDAGHVAFEQPIDVALPGGILEITVQSDRTVRMKGPARRVFRGEVYGR
jgi:diaminopimelate epimerase